MTLVTETALQGRNCNPPRSFLPWHPHVHARLSYCTEIPMDHSKWKLYIFLCHTGPGVDFLLCTTWGEQQGQSSFKKPSLFFSSACSQDKTRACCEKGETITMMVMPWNCHSKITCTSQRFICSADSSGVDQIPLIAFVYRANGRYGQFSSWQGWQGGVLKKHGLSLWQVWRAVISS